MKSNLLAFFIFFICFTSSVNGRNLPFNKIQKTNRSPNFELVDNIHRELNFWNEVLRFLENESKPKKTYKPLQKTRFLKRNIK